MALTLRDEALTHPHVPFNFIIGILDGGFFGFAMGFASFAAVIPLFVDRLTDSALLIGLVPAIHNVGWQFPQLFTAGWVARARRFKPLVMWLTIHERIPFIGMALVAWFLPRLGPQTALVLLFALLVWQGVGGGLAANPWQNMITRIIPRGLHGTFYGVQAASSNALGGLAAVLSGLVLDRLYTPANFALCFLVAAASMGVSLIVLGQTREEAGQTEPPAIPRTSWADARHILREDHSFRAFLAVRFLSQFANMAFAFYLIYAVKTFGMSPAQAGIMTGVLLVSQVLSGPLMGRFGDRWSHRGVMALGALAAAASALLAWRADSAQWFYLVFLLEALAITATWIVPLALTVRFARRDSDRPLYIGLSNTIAAPATILAPVLGGLIADAAGFHLTFLLTAGFALLMAAALAVLVREPELHPVEP